MKRTFCFGIEVTFSWAEGQWIPVFKVAEVHEFEPAGVRRITGLPKALGTAVLLHGLLIAVLFFTTLTPQLFRGLPVDYHRVAVPVSHTCGPAPAAPYCERHRRFRPCALCVVPRVERAMTGSRPAPVVSEHRAARLPSWPPEDFPEGFLPVTADLDLESSMDFSGIGKR